MPGRSRMSLLEHALRAIRGKTFGEHVHIFREGADCTCGRTFDQAVRSQTDHFILELGDSE